MPAGLTPDDREAIRELLYRYAWALDTGDVEAFAALFASDAIFVWDAFEEPDEWRGQAEIRAFAEDLRDLPSTAGRQHCISNVIVEPADTRDRARAMAYVAVLLNGDRDGAQVTVTGWYDDTFVRVDGEWKIARHVIRDWSGPILHRLAGQNGARVARARPPMLEGLGRRQSASEV